MRDLLLPPTASAPRRVLVLGDSITYAGGWLVALETRLIQAFPRRPIELLNLGLPSEMGGDADDGGEHARRHGFPRPPLSERLERVLDAVRPELVLACYGMNDGHGGAWNEAWFAAFQDGQRRLRAAVARRIAPLVHLTPPVYDPQAPKACCDPSYEQVLGCFAAWLRGQAAEGWRVVDLHLPMAAALAERRAADPAAGFGDDGVHPGEDGHWAMARGLFAALGDQEAVAAPSLAALLPARLAGLPALVRQRMELRRDAWLAHTRHTRPGLAAGLPLAEAESQAAELGARIAAAAG
jgi:lysophospholipase L1-like esterase